MAPPPCYQISGPPEGLTAGPGWVGRTGQHGTRFQGVAHRACSWAEAIQGLIQAWGPNSVNGPAPPHSHVASGAKKASITGLAPVSDIYHFLLVMLFLCSGHFLLFAPRAGKRTGCCLMPSYRGNPACLWAKVSGQNSAQLLQQPHSSLLPHCPLTFSAL